MLESRAAIDNLTLDVAYGRVNLGEVRNQKQKWGDLRLALSKPSVGHESMAEYKALSKPDRDKLKNVGFFIGANCAGGKRKAHAIEARSVVTFDIDEGGSPALVAALTLGMTPLAEYEHVVYSTRSSTPDKPRLRVVIPLLAPIKAEAYEPLTRILAAKLDTTVEASMMAVTRESFRLAQMMYLPSMSRDSEWVFIHNEGQIVDGNKVLADFGNWRDFTLLPFADDQSITRLSPAARKAEDPTTKRGVIGAFCRAYDVESAIAEFLPETYVPGDDNSGKPRYTYVGGSTSNGAIVEDDGLFLYSYHAHDPCCDTLVNSWDLVRIHRFEHLDVKTRPTEHSSPVSLPSHKAMVEFAMSLPEVLSELASAQHDLSAIFKDYGEAVDEIAEPQDPIDALLGIDDALGLSQEDLDREWFKQLELTPKGEIKNTVANIALIIAQDPRFRGSIELNTFTNQIVTRAPILSKISILKPWKVIDKTNGDPWTDRHDQYLRVILESAHGEGKAGYGLKVADRDLVAGVEIAAQARPFHPVKIAVEATKWDGVPRLRSYLTTFLGAEDSEYTQAVGSIWLTAAIARVYEPGHKFDFVMILEGAQGKGKSTFFSVLAGDWFSELKSRFDDPAKIIEALQGSWIVELPELSQFKRSTLEEIKAFASSSHDKARLAFARRVVVAPRQCVMGGTTNKNVYLQDPTGGRRWWPIACNVDRIDLAELRRAVPQLWAEALVEYRAMRAAKPYGALPLYLAEESVEAAAMAVQESRREDDEAGVWASVIQEWLERPVPEGYVAPTGRPEGVLLEKLFEDNDPLAEVEPVYRKMVCGLEVWCELFGRDIDDYGRAASLQVNAALQNLKGWSMGGRFKSAIYGQQRMFVPDSVKKEKFSLSDLLRPKP